MRFFKDQTTSLARGPLGKVVFALIFLCGLASAQSALTTIQDTLFKADGTRFSGTVTITWSTFDAANIGTIIQQSKTATHTLSSTKATAENNSPKRGPYRPARSP
jgi:hypothetical protein